MRLYAEPLIDPNPKLDLPKKIGERTPPKLFWQGKEYTWFTNETREHTSEPWGEFGMDATRRKYPGVVFGPAYDPEGIGLNLWLVGAYLTGKELEDWYDCVRKWRV